MTFPLWSWTWSRIVGKCVCDYVPTYPCYQCSVDDRFLEKKNRAHEIAQGRRKMVWTWQPYRRISEIIQRGMQWSRCPKGQIPSQTCRCLTRQKDTKRDSIPGPLFGDRISYSMGRTVASSRLFRLSFSQAGVCEVGMSGYRVGGLGSETMEVETHAFRLPLEPSGMASGDFQRNPSVKMLAGLVYPILKLAKS